MAVFSMKTNKFNNRKHTISLGISLTVTFSIIFLTLIFNLLPIFTKIMLGTFGVLIYPASLFFIIIGIMLICDKKIKCSKSMLFLLLLWAIFFVLILQLATSKTIDLGFSYYITDIFKNSLTAGGVVFGFLLYPFYFISHNVACYVIFSIALIIITSFIIDRIHFEFKNKKIESKENNADENLELKDDSDEILDNEFDDDSEKQLITTSKLDKNIDNDIFIEDEDDIEIKSEAKSILGLNKLNEENTMQSMKKQPDNLDYKDKLQASIDKNTKVTENTNKPNIFVHNDDFNIVGDSKISNNIKQSKEENLNDKRKKDALKFLEISNGKFETKRKQSGIDNVKSKKHLFDKDDSNNLNSQYFPNKTEIQKGVNPFKVQENKDIYDPNLSKESFINSKSNANSYNNSNFKNNYNSNTQDGNFVPKKAQEFYNGNVRGNMVESNSFRPVQVSMNDPKPVHHESMKVKKTIPYNRPPIDLLKRYPDSSSSDDNILKEKGELIVKTLSNFKIETKIINAVKGPTFTRYELQMAPGISVNSINNKINDLQMALEGRCRVQVPIPGKNAFGIEVPNKKRQTVGLREIIESPNFQTSKSPLTFALGKDITAECKVACIDKLVHTLVAGSTGSGKSVCLNTLLVSLLYKASPDDLRLVLVDPKSVEFTLFNGLPHMLIPNTITECDKAVDALNWLVQEMERRYKRLSSIGVKKISEYNQSDEVISGSIPKMFYIVMVFDEVGDFMLRAKKEIEEKIIILSQKSRACGIHLILATQRPTVDVITGTIKANLSTRISFAVKSLNDSRTILDCSGAEYLLGMGDMLFLPQGSNELERIQGCFIDNNELKSVINYIKENNECDFDEQIEDEMFNKNNGFDPTNGLEESFDPLMKDCLRYFIKAKKASASSLQTMFSIGYPKANKIMMQMEKAGFVSAGDNNGRRTLFITKQEFEERFGEDLDE